MPSFARIFRKTYNGANINNFALIRELRHGTKRYLGITIMYHICIIFSGVYEAFLWVELSGGAPMVMGRKINWRHPDKGAKTKGGVFQS